MNTNQQPRVYVLLVMKHQPAQIKTFRGEARANQFIESMSYDPDCLNASLTTPKEAAA